MLLHHARRSGCEYDDCDKNYYDNGRHLRPPLYFAFDDQMSAVTLTTSAFTCGNFV